MKFYRLALSALLLIPTVKYFLEHRFDSPCGVIVWCDCNCPDFDRVGKFSHRYLTGERESPVSTMVGSVLGLTAFILAFTFGIVFERYDARKGLVREEANAIGTAYLRADFLPEPDQTETKSLYRNYLDMRIAFAQSTVSRNRTREELTIASFENKSIHDRLWEIAVSNAQKDTNSKVAALYIESLNQVIDIHALRVAIGIQARIPGAIWLMLLGVTFLGMLGIGFQAGITSSNRSIVQPILAVAFALVITLIASLDRNNAGIITVSQQSLIDLRNSLDDASANDAANAR